MPLVGGPVTDDVDGVPLLGGEDNYRWWRFRIHARGRDATSSVGAVYADQGDEVPEQHLIQAWPAPRAAESRLKLTDQVGTRSHAPAAK
ncbi:hypothetical protein ACIHFE_32970 [Streptomyces sp. NPDC052396]|uniref:hypothetical protein n=1 Tax=Streptomyces sp. NPDC052396 TaxID=3365689 RepID=UPI0037D21C0E